MIDLTIDSDARALLSSAKGKILKSYEFVPLRSTGGSGVAFRHCGVNFGRSSLDLSCLLQRDGEYDELDDWPSLICAAAVEGDGSFESTFGGSEVIAFWVDEKIVGVDVVNDKVEVFAGRKEKGADAEPTLRMDIDVAVVFRTANHRLAFSRDSWDTELICVELDLDPTVSFTAEDHERFWTYSPGESDKDAEVGVVTRTVIEL